MADIRVTIETDHAILKDLSPEQVKELRDILCEMFPPEEGYRVYPIYPYYPRPWPWYTYTSGETTTTTPEWRYWDTSTTGSSMRISSSTTSWQQVADELIEERAPAWQELACA